MARTVDVAAHAARQEEILDAAQKLIVTRGYERMSIQDVLGELGISKGALYHYYGSKHDLLAGIVDRTADQVRARLATVADDPELGARDRIVRIFHTLVEWKTQHRDELVALLRVWNSAGNALMRQRTRAGITHRLAPLFERVIEDGVADGTFTLPTAGGSGHVLLCLVQDLNEHLGELFFAYESGTAGLNAVEQTVTAYTSAMERILGVTAGSVTLVDLPALYTWFDPHWQEEEGSS